MDWQHENLRAAHSLRKAAVELAIAQLHLKHMKDTKSHLKQIEETLANIADIIEGETPPWVPED